MPARRQAFDRFRGFPEDKEMAVMKNIGQYVETALIVTLALVALAGIVRFIVIALG